MVNLLNGLLICQHDHLPYKRIVAVLVDNISVASTFLVIGRCMNPYRQGGIPVAGEHNVSNHRFLWPSTQHTAAFKLQADTETSKYIFFWRDPFALL